MFVFHTSCLVGFHCVMVQQLVRPGSTNTTHERDLRGETLLDITGQDVRHTMGASQRNCAPGASRSDIPAASSAQAIRLYHKRAHSEVSTVTAVLAVAEPQQITVDVSRGSR